MHVGTHSHDLSHMLLHISSQPLPFFACAAQRRQKMKVVVLGCELLEFRAIVKILLAARAKEEPKLVFLVAVGLREKPVQHGAKWGDAGSRRDENRIA